MENGQEIWHMEFLETVQVGSVTTVSRELAWYKLGLVGVQDFGWDKGGHSKNRGVYFVHGKMKQISSIGNRTSVHHQIKSAVKRVEFVSDRMSYVVLRGRWCNIILLNVHAPSEMKNDYSKDRFYEELEQVFHHFLKYRKNILLGGFNAKLGRKNIFKPTTGNQSIHQDNYNGVRIVTFATSKKSICYGNDLPAPKH